MKIHDAVYLTSAATHQQGPPPTLPEYAFIGRSNVGKSSLINMLVQQEGLAKTSSTPGKTQTINHFRINHSWLLADLPGYGFAKVSVRKRAFFDRMIHTYATERENLQCIFVLLDSRLPAQAVDLAFMRWLGQQAVPFAMVFTKADKQSATRNQALLADYNAQMRAEWEELPPQFVTSATTGAGREALLAFIAEINQQFVAPTAPQRPFDFVRTIPGRSSGK